MSGIYKDFYGNEFHGDGREVYEPTEKPKSDLMIAHWPGKDTPACPEHLLKLKNLATFMGFPLSCTPAPEGMECANCNNERKR